MILLIDAALFLGCLAIVAWLLKHPGEEPVPPGGNGYRDPEERN